MNKPKEQILVSACLIGENCRFDGTGQKSDAILKLTAFYDIIPFCPEVSGGMKTPRPNSEIKDGKVIDVNGKDVTEFYHSGAYWAAAVCQLHSIHLAILKENSPSCGVHAIHDGSFSGKKIPGEGFTTARLRKMGVTVINENEAAALLEKLEKGEH